MPPLRPLIIALLILTATVEAAERRQVHKDDYRLSITPRTPEQIGAFYEARGFPKQAVEILKQQCYMTVFFHNTSDNIIWMDLNNWQFHTTNGELKRLDRSYWKIRWQSLDLPQRFQSTFRWTLMPEHLDYRPDEREGGNLILPYTDAAIRLKARLRIVSKQGEHEETIGLEGIRCAR